HSATPLPPSAPPPHAAPPSHPPPPHPPAAPAPPPFVPHPVDEASAQIAQRFDTRRYRRRRLLNDFLRDALYTRYRRRARSRPLRRRTAAAPLGATALLGTSPLSRRPAPLAPPTPPPHPTTAPPTSPAPPPRPP